eukprot:g29301.t1
MAMCVRERETPVKISKSKEASERLWRRWIQLALWLDPKKSKAKLPGEVWYAGDKASAWVMLLRILGLSEKQLGGPLSILEDMCCTTYPMIRTLRAMT